MYEYYKTIANIHPQITTFTDENWKIPSIKEYEEWLATIENIWQLQPFRGYDYMVYLRHHGFPSPLLDWTKSPYIAAFFAYRTVGKEVKDVSIYALYIDKYARVKEEIRKKTSPSSDELFVMRLHPEVKTHKRHFLQQSQYTICLELEGNTYYYSYHGKIFYADNQLEDGLYKFNLPVSERKEFLKKLDSMNINAFSLFGTEESLMETIALRESEFKIN